MCMACRMRGMGSTVVDRGKRNGRGCERASRNAMVNVRMKVINQNLNGNGRRIAQSPPRPRADTLFNRVRL